MSLRCSPVQFTCSCHKKVWHLRHAPSSFSLFDSFPALKPHFDQRAAQGPPVQRTYSCNYDEKFSELTTIYSPTLFDVWTWACRGLHTWTPARVRARNRLAQRKDESENGVEPQLLAQRPWANLYRLASRRRVRSSASQDHPSESLEGREWISYMLVRDRCLASKPARTDISPRKSSPLALSKDFSMMTPKPTWG